MKKIINIVFYNFIDENNENRVQTAIYYNDGTTYSCSYEEGIEIAKKYMKEEKISTKDFKKILNKKKIYAITGEEFERDYKKFMPTTAISTIVKDLPEKTEKELAQEQENYKKASELAKEVIRDMKNIKNAKNSDQMNIAIQKYINDRKALEELLRILPKELVDKIIEENPNVQKKIKVEDKKQKNTTTENNTKEKKTTTNKSTKPEEKQKSKKSTDTTKKDNTQEEKQETKKEEKTKATETTTTKEKTKDKKSSTETTAIKKEKKKSEKGIRGLINRVKTKIDKKKKEIAKAKEEAKKELEKSEKTEDGKKKKGIWKRITAFIVAASILASGYGLAFAKTSKNVNEDANNNRITTESNIEDGKDLTGDEALAMYNNDYYDTYTFKQLLKVNTVEAQKNSMDDVGYTIDKYNGEFANIYAETLEDGTVVKPALSWDQVMALNIAYNDYSKEEIKAMFNGATISSEKFSNAYKMANLQLMGAYVISTSENPIDMTGIVNSPEGDEFLGEYQTMYYELKDLSGDELEAKVAEFRNKVKADFPITDEIREVGIAHSEPREIESYKLTAIPVIAAFEAEYRNVAVDQEETLNDKEIDYLNDTALCNIADEKFEQVETITLTSEEDNSQPLYEQYKNAKIKELEKNDNYNISDENVDLSRMTAFQERINGHFVVENGELTGAISYGDGSSYTTSTYTKSKTTYRTEETRTEAEIPEDEKNKIDQEIEKENEQAKEEAEKEAQEKEEQLQEEADKETAKNEEEIKKDDQDMQDKIDDANDKINENNKDDNKENDKPVNEDDFGDHNVDFDDEHSNENGDLDDSVENITKDPTGDQTGEELPDPNKTGESFDGSIIDQTSSQGGNGNQTDQNIFEYEEPVAKTNEQLADEIVEAMANQTYEEEVGYQYTR